MKLLIQTQRSGAEWTSGQGMLCIVTLASPYKPSDALVPKVAVIQMENFS